jgi:hypothetical protein
LIVGASVLFKPLFGAAVDGRADIRILAASGNTHIGLGAVGLPDYCGAVVDMRVLTRLFVKAATGTT